MSRQGHHAYLVTVYFEPLQHLEGAVIQVRNGAIWEHLSFQFGENNGNPESLNGQVDFRQAVAHAIDGNRLAVAGGWINEGPLSSFFDVSGVSTDAEGWDRYHYDPALAVALLADACTAVSRDCTADPPVVVLSTTSNSALRLDVAAELQNMLAAVGIELRVEPSDSFFTSSFLSGSWDTALFAFPPAETGWSGVIHTLGFWDPAGAPPLGRNYARWGTAAVEGNGPDFDQPASTVVDAHTARYEDIVIEMQGTFDTERLGELAAEAEEILAEQAVIIPIKRPGISIKVGDAGRLIRACINALRAPEQMIITINQEVVISIIRSTISIPIARLNKQWVGVDIALALPAALNIAIGNRETAGIIYNLLR